MPASSMPPTVRAAEWWTARAALAARRLRPVVPWAITLFLAMVVATLAVRGPLAAAMARSARRSAQAVDAQRDTIGLARRLAASRDSLQALDAAMQSLAFRAEQRAAAPLLDPVAQHARDSLRALIAPLEVAMDRVARAPLTTSYRALAATRALLKDVAVQVALDSLTVVERARQSLDPAVAPQRAFADFTERTNRIGTTLLALARARRDAMVREVAVLESAVPLDPVFDEDTLHARLARDTARATEAGLVAALREARLYNRALGARADSAARASTERVLGTSPVLAASAVSLLLVVLAFAVAVAREARRPTIASAREAERLTRIPVLATSPGFVPPREGRARLQPGSGVDPFRMVYLTLTASGTKERTVAVTGEAADLVSAVAARIAVSAAADDRATVVVDLAPGISGASAHFGWRDEPGFTEALAAVRLWNEVRRSVGASDSVSIDVVPAGAPRQDTLEALRSPTAIAEFERFHLEYDFTVLVAPTPASVDSARLAASDPPVLLVVRQAGTPLDWLLHRTKEMSDTKQRCDGILLV